MQELMHLPRVSVVIPTHNRPNLVGRAIQSVLQQDFTDIEILVVDDGTEQRSRTTVESFRDDRIRYLENERSMGAPASRNRGVRESRADLIAFLDDDDEWEIGKISAQVRGFDIYPSVVASHTSIVLYDEKTYREEPRMHAEEGVVDVYDRTLYRPYIWTSALMVRKEIFAKVEGFDESFPKNQEWDLVLRLAEYGPFFAVGACMVRIHVLEEHEHMGGRMNLPNIVKGHEMLLAKHAEAYMHHSRARGRVSFILFGLYREAHNLKGMRTWAYEAWKAQPWNTVYFRHLLALFFGLRFYESIRKLTS